MRWIHAIVLLVASSEFGTALRPVTPTSEDPKNNSKNGSKEDEGPRNVSVDLKEVEEMVGSALKVLDEDELAVEHYEAGKLGRVLFVYLIIPVVLLPFYVCFVRPHVYTRYDSFATGIFDCWGDARICLFSLFCPCMRWADTVSKEKAGLVNFFLAFFMFLLLVIAGKISRLGYLLAPVALTVLGTIYRQKLRATYGLTSWTLRTILEDCWVWYFCCPCAIAQEARHVEWFEGEIDRITEAKNIGRPPPSTAPLKAPVREEMAAASPPSKGPGQGEPQAEAEAEEKVPAKVPEDEQQDSSGAGLSG